MNIWILVILSLVILTIVIVIVVLNLKSSTKAKPGEIGRVIGNDTPVPVIVPGVTYAKAPNVIENVKNNLKYHDCLSFNNGQIARLVGTHHDAWSQDQKNTAIHTLTNYLYDTSNGVSFYQGNNTATAYTLDQVCNFSGTPDTSRPGYCTAVNANYPITNKPAAQWGQNEVNTAINIINAFSGQGVSDLQSTDKTNLQTRLNSFCSPSSNKCMGPTKDYIYWSEADRNAVIDTIRAYSGDPLSLLQSLTNKNLYYRFKIICPY